ncbi:hypothetical protein BGW38_004608 [Lunasporangiospora selenospora]|uniref:Uncharacterized protein n=1 Tax=Lunasporangiospora selenospora TaxID=979761 RepID=A0A9P6KBF2_9FUNG|nr:hypothetical protein BGW38_004608 [Lunasporangiospora selenospora]
MASGVTWANEVKLEKGKWVEHVSFGSFVKRFDIRNKEVAMAHYAALLNSPYIKEKRRQRLQVAYADFKDSRLRDFWASWKQSVSLNETQNRLLCNATIIRKETAILAQQASLRDSASSFEVPYTGWNQKFPTPSSSAGATSTPTAPDTEGLDSVGNASLVEAQDISKEQADRTDAQDDSLEESTSADEAIVWSPAKSSPFYELVRYIFSKAKNKYAPFPVMPSDLSENHRQMFEKAVELLREPGDILRKKEILVITSGIINTISRFGIEFRLSQRIVEESLHPCMANKLPTIARLVTELLSALYPDEDLPHEPSMSSLQSLVYSKLVTESTKTRRTKEDQEIYVFLKIICQILMWLEHGLFVRPTSEHVYVSAWSSIFNTLFAGGGLRVIPGELASQASKHCRQLTEDGFGTRSANGTNGRKVDLTLRVLVDSNWIGEVAVFESKPVVTDATCVKQQNKSVRLNAAILYNLESRGLDISQWYPIIAETRALAADFYTIKRYEDVLGVGKATKMKCWIPADCSQLKGFLRSESMNILLGFRLYV